MAAGIAGLVLLLAGTAAARPLVVNADNGAGYDAETGWIIHHSLLTARLSEVGWIV
jgi:hypothetical protein